MFEGRLGQEPQAPIITLDAKSASLYNSISDAEKTPHYAAWLKMPVREQLKYGNFGIYILKMKGLI